MEPWSDNQFNNVHFIDFYSFPDFLLIHRSQLFLPKNILPAPKFLSWALFFRGIKASTPHCMISSLPFLQSLSSLDFFDTSGFPLTSLPIPSQASSSTQPLNVEVTTWIHLTRPGSLYILSLGHQKANALAPSYLSYQQDLMQLVSSSSLTYFFTKLPGHPTFLISLQDHSYSSCFSVLILTLPLPLNLLKLESTIPKSLDLFSSLLLSFPCWVHSVSSL